MDMNYSSNIKVKERRQKKSATAMRGMRSLGLAIAIPLSLNLANITLFGWTRHSYQNISSLSTKPPFWFPPLWTMYLMDMTLSVVMGLSAWLMWAKGGFHQKPRAVAMYLSQLALSLVCNPMEASQVCLLVCLSLFGSLIACSWIFSEVNPIAGDLVKPCIAWSGFLTLVNLKLVYL